MCDFAVWSGNLDRYDVEFLGLQCGMSNRDATGVALNSGGSIQTLKGPVEAEDFYMSTKWNALWDNYGESCKSGMVHSRIATNGNPEFNKNNHPHVSESGSVLVHNGVVRPVTKMTDAVSDCDSEQILRSLDAYGFEKGLQNISGWAHIAYMPFFHQDYVYLFSNSTPLQVHTTVDGIVIVNTGRIEFDIEYPFEHEIEDTDVLDLNQWYCLNINNPSEGIQPWKKATLNDTQDGYFGKSERSFRSKLKSK